MAKKKAKPKATRDDVDAATTGDGAPEVPFEEALAELERVVGDLEGGDLGLEEALSRYESGVTRLRQCHQQLEAAARKVEVLSGIDADGNPVTTPLEDPEASLADPGGRGRKRSAGAGVDDATRLF